MMNTEHLATFIAVAEARNYTHAADALHLSQSAVWRQMRQLEAWVGARLFEAVGRRLDLSDAGRSLLVEARDLLAHLERMQERVRTGGHGRLRIGASTTPGHSVVPRILGAYHRLHPSTELAFEVDNSTAIQRKILHNDLDLAFVGSPLEDEDLVREVCLDDEVVCFASPDHPLAGLERVRPERLSRELCVIREEGSATRGLFGSWLEERGCKLGPTLSLRSLSALKTLVMEGVGYSFLSIHAIEKELEAGTLRRLAVRGMRLERPILMTWHRRKHLGPHLDGFVRLTRELCAR